MKKQELIHVHHLLSEVSNQIETWEDEEIDLEDYYAMNIRPTSIHRSKTDHKAAVYELADAIVEEIEESYCSTKSSEFP